MVDQEHQDGQTGIDHVAGGERCLNGVLEHVGFAGRMVVQLQLDGQPDVDDEDHRKPRADSPEGCFRHGVQAVGVGVDPFRASEDEKVACQVSRKEQDQT